MKMPKSFMPFVIQEEKKFRKGAEVKSPDHRDVDIWKALKLIKSFYEVFGEVIK